MSIKLLISASVVGCVLVLAACRRDRGDAPVLKRDPFHVQVSAVQESTVPALYVASGTVRAKATSVLSSKVMATVRSVSVRAGDRVAEGQVLIILDVKDLDAQFESAQAAQQGARSSVVEADSGMASAKANLDLAEVTFERMKTLYDQRSISNQEFDEANAKVKAARSSYDMAVAKRQQGESAVAQSEAGVRAADVNRSYSRIIAPFAGIVTEKNVEPGSLAVPGNPLVTIEGQGSYRMEAAVEESRLSAVHLGEKVDVEVDGIDELLGGRVSEMAPTIDPSTRSYTVKIDLQNRPSLRSGLFGRAQFRSGERKALTIPAGAVRTTGQLESVMVVEGGNAHVRIITTGTKDNTAVTVLSGLDPGDKLIHPVPAGLVDGSPVEVRE